MGHADTGVEAGAMRCARRRCRGRSVAAQYHRHTNAHASSLLCSYRALLFAIALRPNRAGRASIFYSSRICRMPSPESWVSIASGSEWRFFILSVKPDGVGIFVL